MLLYDVFYKKESKNGTRSMDRSIPLPKRPLKGTEYATCVNGAKKYFISYKREWLSATREQALARVKK